MNIKILIADNSKEYINRFVEEFQKYSEFEISVATGYESLKNAIEQKRYDIVLFDPDIADERIDFHLVKLPVSMFDDNQEHSQLYKDFKVIRKYQRISSIYKELIELYSDEAGYSPEFSNDVSTRFIAVYSPGGGTGKTTTALVLSQKLQAAGYSTLFMSMEQLDSSGVLCPRRKDGITELIAAVSKSDADEAGFFEMKLKSAVNEGTGHISYIEGFGRIVDYMDVSKEDIERLIEKIRLVSTAKYVVVDLNSTLDDITVKVLELADRIVLVERNNEMFRYKLGVLSDYPYVQDMWNKVLTIDNFAHGAYTDANDSGAENIGYISDYGDIGMADLVREAVRDNNISLEKLV